MGARSVITTLATTERPRFLANAIFSRRESTAAATDPRTGLLPNSIHGGSPATEGDAKLNAAAARATERRHAAFALLKPMFSQNEPVLESRGARNTTSDPAGHGAA